MSLYSPYMPGDSQFDDNAPWNDSHVEKPIHEIDADEPFVPSSHLPVMPDTPRARAWKQRLADACKEIK